MTDGVLSGKTGFTGNAGYCYVCACEKDGKTFIISLLGCGWPNHKTYKWKDTLALLQYGSDNFSYQTFYEEPMLGTVEVSEGVSSGARLGSIIYLSGNCQIPEEEKQRRLLVKKGESFTYKVTMPKTVEAPVAKRGADR